MKKVRVLTALILLLPLQVSAKVQINAFKESSAPSAPYSKIVILFEPTGVISSIAERELAEKLSKKSETVFITGTDLGIVHDTPEATQAAKEKNDKAMQNEGIEAVLICNLVNTGSSFGTQMKPNFGYTYGSVGNTNMSLNTTSLSPVTVSYITWTHNIGLVDYNSKKVVWKAVSGTAGKNEDSMRKDFLNKVVSEFSKSNLSY